LSKARTRTGVQGADLDHAERVRVGRGCFMRAQGRGKRKEEGEGAVGAKTVGKSGEACGVSTGSHAPSLQATPWLLHHAVGLDHATGSGDDDAVGPRGVHRQLVAAPQVSTAGSPGLSHTCVAAPLCQLRAACRRYTDDTQTKTIGLAQNAERCGPRNCTRKRGRARAATACVSPFRLGNCSFGLRRNGGVAHCPLLSRSPDAGTTRRPPPSPPAQSVVNKVDGCGF
jgi:hypothetical protein